MAKDAQHDTTSLRWGFSTGASMCALALGLWEQKKQPLQQPLPHVSVLFLDGHSRLIPLYSQEIQGMLAVQKDGGDDPDCTHKALFYGFLREASVHEAQAEDYILPVGEAQLIVHALEGIGLCKRRGLDCTQGKWAINTGPREMLAKNLLRAGMRHGVWLFACGVVDGAAMAKHSLNAHLGIEGGISILGSTGLVRPFSHDAYKATIRLSVRAHHTIGGSSMVFCTGGRTKKGARKHLGHLEESAFTCIADFIEVSLQSACTHAMQHIYIACMPGKLCKYAAGYANTHAHKAQQDMRILGTAVQEHMPEAIHVQEAVLQSATVREALLCIPDSQRDALLQRVAEQALEQLEKFTFIRTQLHILLFDFQGTFLFEKSRTTQRVLNMAERKHLVEQEAITKTCAKAVVTAAHIEEDYFLQKGHDPCKH